MIPQIALPHYILYIFRSFLSCDNELSYIFNVIFGGMMMWHVVLVPCTSVQGTVSMEFLMLFPSLCGLLLGSLVSSDS